MGLLMTVLGFKWGFLFPVFINPLLMLVPSLLYISSNETLLFLNIANEEQIRGKEKQARLTVLSCVVRRSL